MLATKTAIIASNLLVNFRHPLYNVEFTDYSIIKSATTILRSNEKSKLQARDSFDLSWAPAERFHLISASYILFGPLTRCSRADRRVFDSPSACIAVPLERVHAESLSLVCQSFSCSARMSSCVVRSLTNTGMTSAFSPCSHMVMACFPRVRFAGMGLVSPLGVGIERCWKRILASQSGLAALEEKVKDICSCMLMQVCCKLHATSLDIGVLTVAVQSWWSCAANERLPNRTAPPLQNHHQLVRSHRQRQETWVLFSGRVGPSECQVLQLTLHSIRDCSGTRGSNGRSMGSCISGLTCERANRRGHWVGDWIDE
jgi:hypothetical protein